MERRTNIRTYIAIIVLIGVISSLINSDIPFREIFQSMGGSGTGLEAILDTVNLWLGLLVFGVLIALVIFLITREDVPPSFRQFLDDKED
jgi:hypothetical protein